MNTSLKVTSINPNNKTITKTAAYANPKATNAQLNSFAQAVYGGLSNNSVDKVWRVDTTNITDAKPPLVYTLTAPIFADVDFITPNIDAWTRKVCPDAVAEDSFVSLAFDETDTSQVILTYTRNKAFSGTETTTQTFNATSALSGNVAFQDGDNHSDVVEITYGDLITIFNSSNCVQTYFDVLNQKLSQKGNISVIYNPADSELSIVDSSAYNQKVSLIAYSRQDFGYFWLKELYDYFDGTYPQGVTFTRMEPLDDYRLSVNYTES